MYLIHSEMQGVMYTAFELGQMRKLDLLEILFRDNVILHFYDEGIIIKTDGPAREMNKEAIICQILNLQEKKKWKRKKET